MAESSGRRGTLQTLAGTDRRVLALAFARMADALGNSFLIVVLPTYIANIVGEGMGVFATPLGTELLIGVVLSLFGLLNSVLQPLTGRLSDRTGRRRAFILTGLVVLGVGSGAYPFVDSYPAVMFLRALQGVGAALTIPATVALVNELATTADRGGNFGVFNTFRLVGFGFGPIVAGAVQQAYGVNAAFAVAVAGAAVSFGMVVVLVEDPERTEATAAENLSVSVRGDGRLLDPVFALGVATVCMALTIALFAALKAPINERLGQGDFLFGVQFAAAVIGNVVFQLPVGNAADAYGRRPFIVGGFVVLVPSVLAQGLVGSSLAMVGARLLQGVAVAMVFAPSLAVAGDLAGEGQSGSTLSVLTMGFGLGVAAGPTAAGLLFEFGFAVPFLFGGGVAVLGLALVYTQVVETLDAPASVPAD
ncbi:MAG: MFS transporter [Halobacteriaceae archaeon]